MPLNVLCLRCGMCCDGTLFTHVSLQPEEAAELQQRGLPIGSRADGGPALTQHCAALEERACTVYTDRPASCRLYQCQLFSAVAEKEVSLEEALAVVDEAHSRVAAVALTLAPSPAGAPRAVLQRARRARLAEHGGPLSEKAQATYERAEGYLDRHFRGRFRRRD